MKYKELNDLLNNTGTDYTDLVELEEREPRFNLNYVGVINCEEYVEWLEKTLKDIAIINYRDWTEIKKWLYKFPDPSDVSSDCLVYDYFEGYYKAITEENLSKVKEDIMDYFMENNLFDEYNKAKVTVTLEFDMQTVTMGGEEFHKNILNNIEEIVKRNVNRAEIVSCMVASKGDK